jgi:pSer/pThr/pTyr-binding forkhead associated (FHA) protein
MLEEIERNLIRAFRDTGKQRLGQEPAERLRRIQALLDDYVPPDSPGAYLLLIAEGRVPEWSGVRTNWVIGRSAEANLQLLHPWVTHEHCRLDFDDEDWLLEDLSSQNKTYVNGEPVTRHLLCNGDVLGIGPMRLVFMRTFG